MTTLTAIQPLDDGLQPLLTPAVTVTLAIAAGSAAANVWYSQPMLAAIATDFGAAGRNVAALPAATQLGFAIGVLLLLPLGDKIDRRRLIVSQFLGLAAAALAAAFASNLTVLIAALLLVGFGASAAQQVVAFAAGLAPSGSRGRAIGVVMSGLLCGGLLARLLSGSVADRFGWRAMYVVAAMIAFVVALGARVVLPRSASSTRDSYAALVLSLATLVRAHPALRRAALVQACIFATISGFWAVLALLLQGPEFGLGATSAGLFGVIGVAGVLAAPAIGRFADAQGPHRGVGLGIALVMASFVLFMLRPTLPALVVGVLLVDLGAQASLVSNQSIIYSLDAKARGRITTIFMTVFTLGGAFGSGGAGIVWAFASGGTQGFRAVCGFCLVLAAVAATIHAAAPVRR